MKKVSLTANVILNIIRQGCSIVFPLVTLVYVAPVLGNVNYGIFNTALANISYFFLVAALGISTYAIREGSKIEKPSELNRFCSEVFSVNLLSTAIAYIALFVYLLVYGRIDVYSTIVLILSSGILLTTIGADWVNTIFEDFRYLTIRYIVFQIVSFVFIFFLVKGPDDLIKYVIIYSFALYGGFVLNLLYIRKYVKLRITFKINKKHIIPIMVLFANAIAIGIYVSSDITILSAYCTESQVGVYSFSTKLYTATKQIINAFIMVTLPRVSLLIETNKRQYYSLMKTIFSALILIVLPVTAVFICEAKEIIMVVGGEKYITGYRCLIILSFALLFALLGSYISNNIVLVSRKEKISLIATIASALINIILNFILIPVYGIEAAALTTLIAEISNFAFQMYWSRSLFDLRIVLKKKDLMYVIGTIIIILECILIKEVIICGSDRINAFVKVIVSILAAMITYSGFLVIVRNEIAIKAINKIINILRKTKSVEM